MIKKINILFIAILITMLIIILILVFKNEISNNNEIVIPVISDLTGSIALYGQWAVDGMTTAMDEINNNGGLNGRKIKLYIEDGESNSKSGANAFNKILSTAKPGVIIVATNTSTVMACATIANNNRVVLFTPIASGPIISKAGAFVFRNRVSGYYEAEIMGRLAAGRLNYKKIALAIINNDAGPGYIQAFKESFESNDRTIIETEYIEPGETDFRTSIIKIKESKPEAVFLALTVKEAALFIRQSTEIGFKPQWLGMTTIMTDELFKIAAESAEGIIIVAEGADERNQNYNDFARKYLARYGYKPTMNSINGYDAIILLSKEIERFDSDGEKIRDSLDSAGIIHGIGSEYSFDVNGDVNKGLKLFVAKDGSFIPFEKK